MAQSGKSEVAPQQHQRGDISAWKAEIESFFEADWGRLRRLIMQMEEHLWANDDCQEVVKGFDEIADCPAVADEDMVPERTGSGQRIAGVAVEDALLKRHRLTKLSEQIEHRIRAASAGLR